MIEGMKLVMTRKALDAALYNQHYDETGDALEIVPDEEAPSGHSLLICLKHWTPTIPIEVAG